MGRQTQQRRAATTAEPVLDISMHPGGAPGSLGYHDAGGAENAGPVLAAGADRPHAHWERRVHGLCGVLVGKGLLSVDEMRRGWEQLQPQAYDRMSYYEKWAASITNIMLQRGILTQASLDRQRGPEVETDETVRFSPGDVVRVKSEAEFRTRWRKPHLRTPGYCHGVHGVIERVAGIFSSPEQLAFGGRDAPELGSQPLYRVRFRQADLWGAAEEAAGGDTVDVEIYQNWLEPGPDSLPDASHRATPPPLADGHGHGHGTRQEVEEAALEAEAALLPEPPVAAALVAALLEEGAVTAAEVAAAVEAVGKLGQVGVDGAEAPGAVGAALVARAWADDKFKELLLADATAAAAELGIAASNATTTVSKTACRPRFLLTGCAPHDDGRVGTDGADGRGEHREGAQPRGVHALFVLPAADPRPLARLVQVAGLPQPRRPRAALRAHRVRHRTAGQRRGEGARLDGGSEVHGAAVPAGGDGGVG